MSGGIDSVLSYFEVHMWSTPWSNLTDILNMFRNNNLVVYYTNASTILP